jgi:SNF2 family DNA or RNA helicase
VFIGNPQSGGVGLTLLGTKTAPCHTAYFYSNSFSFGSREQAEARNHRIGQINKVIYVDYVYKDSIEEYIADVLNGKRDLADEVKNVHNIKEMLLKVTANV